MGVWIGSSGLQGMVRGGSRLVLSCWAVLACSGAGGPDTGQDELPGPQKDPPGTSSTVDSDGSSELEQEPEPEPFVDALGPGAFWEYSWTERTTDYGVEQQRSSGRFRVALGEQHTVGDRTAYTVFLFGSVPSTRSLDGQWLSFDGSSMWVGDPGAEGVLTFTNETPDFVGVRLLAGGGNPRLMKAVFGDWTTDAISSPASYAISESSDSSKCEYYDSVGTVCGGGVDESYRGTDYYREGTGLVASETTGCYDYLCNYTAVVLEEHQLSGTSSDPWASFVSPIEPGTSASDLANQSDPGYAPSSSSGLSGAFGDYDLTQFTFQHYYELTPVQSGDFSIDLSFTSGNDFDLFVFDDALDDLLGSGTNDNVADMTNSEHATVSLTAGQTYYIAVWAFDTNYANASFTLSVSSP